MKEGRDESRGFFFSFSLPFGPVIVVQESFYPSASSFPALSLLLSQYVRPSNQPALTNLALFFLILTDVIPLLISDQWLCPCNGPWSKIRNYFSLCPLYVISPNWIIQGRKKQRMEGKKNGHSHTQTNKQTRKKKVIINVLIQQEHDNNKKKAHWQTCQRFSHCSAVGVLSKIVNQVDNLPAWYLSRVVLSYIG